MITFPVLKQTPFMCGPYSLKMVLDYYGIHKTIDELTALVKATPDFGCAQNNIINGIKSLGLTIDYHPNSNLAEVKTYLKQNIPVIVLWFSPEFGGHYSVIVDVTDDEVILADPLLGDYRRYSIYDFMFRWFELDDYPPKNPANFTLREIFAINPPKNS